MTKKEPKVKRVTDLETVKKLITRPSKEEREKLAERGIHYVGTDEEFERVQEMIAESGAIEEVTDGDA